MKSKNAGKYLRRSGINPHRRRRRNCEFCQKGEDVSYHNLETLERYLDKSRRIIPSTLSGTCRRHQDQLSNEVRIARELGLLEYSKRLSFGLNQLRGR